MDKFSRNAHYASCLELLGWIMLDSVCGGTNHVFRYVLEICMMYTVVLYLDHNDNDKRDTMASPFLTTGI